MDIRTDISSIRNTGAFRPVASPGEQAAVINTKDTVTSAEATVSIIKKPVIQKAEEIKETEVVKHRPSSSVITGAESIPGPSAAIISAQLRKLESTGVQFLEKRLIPIPFLKHKKIEADEAASILVSGDKNKISRLNVQAGNAAPLPFAELNDIGELSAFKGLGLMPAKEKELAEFIGYAGKIGVEFKTDDSTNVGEYGAHNFLTTGWEISGQTTRPVHLVKEDINIMTIKPGETRSSRELKLELEESWNAVEQIKKPGVKKGALKSFGKPLFDLSFSEKFQAFQQLDKYSDESLKKFSIISKYAESRSEFDEIVDIMKNQGKDYRGDSEFEPDHVELMMKKVFDSDASISEKAEIVRDLKSFLPKGRLGKASTFVAKSFKLIQAKSGNGNEFKRLTKLYGEMVSVMRTDTKLFFKDGTDGMASPRKAFDFITDQLKGDEKEARIFIGLLKGSNIEEAADRYRTLQTPVKAENLDTRIKVSLDLTGTTGFEENYRTVLMNLEPGENPGDLVSLMKSLRRIYKEDSMGVNKRFVEIKEFASKEGISPADCSKVLNAVHSGIDAAADILQAIAKPIGNETFEAQADLFAKLRKQYPESSYSNGQVRIYDYSGLEDYDIVSDRKLHSETLEDAGNRFLLVSDTLGGDMNIEKVRKSFILISEVLQRVEEVYDTYSMRVKRSGSLLTDNLIKTALQKGRNDDAIRKILWEGLKEAAEKSGTESPGIDPSGNNKTIEQDEEKVVIGGIKLNKNK